MSRREQIGFTRVFDILQEEATEDIYRLGGMRTTIGGEYQSMDYNRSLRLLPVGLSTKGMKKATE